MIQYQEASDIEALTKQIVGTLGFSHVDLGRVRFVRSSGSTSRFTVARIHALSRLWRRVVSSQVTYVIEVIGERFDRLSEEDKEKTLIHELLHIPKAFGGGLRPHRSHVNRRTVEKFYSLYRQYRRTGLG
ncbi:MAG: metallopeptidase [Thaumarchaeota archaeon]|nr:metallopeptidase [Nitrososphaerota archaeon]